MKIKKYWKQRNFVYFPDRTTHCKENICSCDDYLQRNFLNCNNKKFILYNPYFEIEDDITVATNGQKNEAQKETNKIPSNIYVNWVSNHSYIAIYFHEKSLEPIYICQILKSKMKTEKKLVDNLVERWFSSDGKSIFRMCLFRKNKKDIKYVYLKLLKNAILVLSRQVFYPCANITDNLSLHFDEYQFLSDRVWSVAHDSCFFPSIFKALLLNKFPSL